MVGVLDEIKALLSPAGAWLWAELGKITFFGVFSKIAEKRIFLIFVDSDLNLCKASQVRAFSHRARASLHRSL